MACAPSDDLAEAVRPRKTYRASRPHLTRPFGFTGRFAFAGLLGKGNQCSDYATAILFLPRAPRKSGSDKEYQAVP